MPEGVEVRWTTRCLKKHFEGLELVQITENTYKGIKNSELFKRPMKCTEIDCKGKLLYMKLEHSNSKLYLTIQFGLTGYFSLDPDKQYKRFSFLFGDVRVYYYDMLNYGNLELLKPKDFFVKIDKLGLDIFNQEEFNQPSLNELIDLYGGYNICVFLLDQSILAGIGNYAKSEILYHSNISPKRTLNSLSEKERVKLYESICFVVYSCYFSGFAETREAKYYDIFNNLNCNLEDVVRDDLERLNMSIIPKKYHIQVYKRRIDLFGNRVERLKTEDGRTTYWVKELQR
jgi:formamidopyrimidine-DNA glycosylase